MPNCHLWLQEVVLCNNGKNPVSAQDGIEALRKAHACSILSFGRFSSTSPIRIPMLVWLNTEGRRSAASFLHSSFLLAIRAVMRRHIFPSSKKVPIASESLPCQLGSLLCFNLSTSRKKGKKLTNTEIVILIRQFLDRALG